MPFPVICLVDFYDLPLIQLGFGILKFMLLFDPGGYFEKIFEFLVGPALIVILDFQDFVFLRAPDILRFGYFFLSNWIF